ncbi:MAG: hypothetical protein ACXWUR_03605 [Allosphingosinicella sp.]
MADRIHGWLPAVAAPVNDRQRLFVRYFTGVLIDLAVLNLFAEYWSAVHVESFTISLLAAVLLQALLKLTIATEHWVASHFKEREGALMTFLRYFCAWLVLFGSKFVILEAISFVFGNDVHFDGALHGIVALIAVVVAMIVVEELIVRIFRRLGSEAEPSAAVPPTP